MKRICLHCLKRWRQHGTYCRTCAQKVGLMAAGLSQLERDRLAVDRLRERDQHIQWAPVQVFTPKPVVIDGIEYDVVFDGSVRPLQETRQ